MARQTINTGSIANDGNGDTLRIAGGKINGNFQELYSLLGGDVVTFGTTTSLTDSGLTFYGAAFDTRLQFTEGNVLTTINLPDSSGELIVNTATQTLTNKTLTAPIINTPTITTATVSALKLKDLDSSHIYTFVTGNISGNRNINIPALTDSDTFTLNAFTQTLTNKTLTSPRIGTAVNDTSGNELIVLTSTISAVNEITLANAAASGKPTVTASGTDTNITLKLNGKGTGSVELSKSAVTSATITSSGAASASVGYIICNAGSSLAVSLANGTIVGETKYFTNKGSAIATITPASFAQGTNVALDQFDAATFIWDGANWYLVGQYGAVIA
jgi:hypothetical protein